MTNIHVKAASRSLTLGQLKSGDIFRLRQDENSPYLYLVLSDDGEEAVDEIPGQTAVVRLDNGNIVYKNIHNQVIRMKSAEFTEE